MSSPSGAVVLDRTSSLERIAGWEDPSFSERMIHFTKRLCVAPRRPEPEFSFCRYQDLCKAINRRNKVRCDCGEDRQELDWQWDHQRASASVRFLPSHAVCHETLSTGTALVLGDTPLTPGWHYFWEVKILSDLYGTDTMVGVCTDRLEPETASQRFVSLLGGCASDRGGSNKAWGFSYHGLKRHAGVSEKYGTPFGKGSVVGVYANMRSGELEFFLNRCSLGVAYTGLLQEDCRLLPAFCTTAANTFVRLITAMSVPDSLQFQTTAVINRRVPDWSLVMPSAICRLIRRFPWLEYPLRCDREQQQNRSLVVVDDSPAQDTYSDRMALARVPAAHHRSDASDTSTDTYFSPAGGAVLPLPAPPRFNLDRDMEDTPDVVVRAGGSRPVRGADRPARFRLFWTPEEEEGEARMVGIAPGGSPPLRDSSQRPVVRIVGGGGTRRRSEVSLSAVTSNSRSVAAVIDAVASGPQSVESDGPDRNLPGNSRDGFNPLATNRAGAGREKRKHARRSVGVSRGKRAKTVRTRRSMSTSDASSASGLVPCLTATSAAGGSGRELAVCVRRSVSASDLSVETDSCLSGPTSSVPSSAVSVPRAGGGNVNQLASAAEEGGAVDSGPTQREAVAVTDTGSVSSVTQTENCAPVEPALEPVEEASRDDTAEVVICGGGELDVGSSEMSLFSVDESQGELVRMMDTALLGDDLAADASSLVSAVGESTSRAPASPSTDVAEKPQPQSATSPPDRSSPDQATANKPVPVAVESEEEPRQPSRIATGHRLAESGQLRLCFSPLEEAESAAISTGPVSSEKSREVVKRARRRSGLWSAPRGSKLQRNMKRRSSRGASEDAAAEGACGKRSEVLPLTTIKETTCPEKEDRATSLPICPKRSDRGSCDTDHVVGVKVKRLRGSDGPFRALDVGILDLADVCNAQNLSVVRETAEVQLSSFRDGKDGDGGAAVNLQTSSALPGVRTRDHVSGPQSGTSWAVVGANTVASAAEPLPPQNGMVQRADPRSGDEGAGVENGKGTSSSRTAKSDGAGGFGNLAPELAPVTGVREMSLEGGRFRNVTVRKGRRRSRRPSVDREGATELKPEPGGVKSVKSNAESVAACSALQSRKSRVSARRLILATHDDGDDGDRSARDVNAGAIGPVTQHSVSKDDVGKDVKTVPIGPLAVPQVREPAAARVDNAVDASAKARENTSFQHSRTELVMDAGTKEKAARRRSSRVRSGVVKGVVVASSRGRRSFRPAGDDSRCDGATPEEGERVFKNFGADVESPTGCEESGAGCAVISTFTLPPGGTEYPVLDSEHSDQAGNSGCDGSEPVDVVAASVSKRRVGRLKRQMTSIRSGDSEPVRPQKRRASSAHCTAPVAGGRSEAGAPNGLRDVTHPVEVSAAQDKEEEASQRGPAVGRRTRRRLTIADSSTLSADDCKPRRKFRRVSSVANVTVVSRPAVSDEAVATGDVVSDVAKKPASALQHAKGSGSESAQRCSGDCGEADVPGSCPVRAQKGGVCTEQGGRGGSKRRNSFACIKDAGIETHVTASKTSKPRKCSVSISSLQDGKVSELTASGARRRTNVLTRDQLSRTPPVGRGSRRASRCYGKEPSDEPTENTALKTRRRASCVETNEVAEEQQTARVGQRRASSVSDGYGKKAVLESSTQVTMRGPSSADVEFAVEKHSDGMEPLVKGRRSSHVGSSAKKIEKRSRVDGADDLVKKQLGSVRKAGRPRTSGVGVEKPAREPPKTSARAIKRRASSVGVEEADAVQVNLGRGCSKRRASCVGLGQGKEEGTKKGDERANKRRSDTSIKQLEERNNDGISHATRRRRSSSGLGIVRGGEEPLVKPATKRRASASLTDQARSKPATSKRRVSGSSTSPSREEAPREEKRAAEPAMRRRASARRSSLSVGGQLDAVVEEEGEDAESPVITRRVRAHRQPRDGAASAVSRLAGTAPAQGTVDQVISASGSSLGPHVEGGEVSEGGRRGRRSSMFRALTSGNRRLRVVLEESVSEL